MSIATPSADNDRGAEQAYRSRWTWDSVAWGTHCVDCYPGNCPYKVYVRDGQVVREEQSGSFNTIEEGVPDFNPMGCNKGSCWSKQLYGGDRITHPMRRVGERGSGEWEQISWDEACTEIADAMLDAIEQGGPEDIAREGTPEIATVVPTDRFFNMFGGRAMDLHASFNDFSIGLHESFGKFCPVSSADDWYKSELILIWHMNPAFTRIPIYHFMNEARYRGAEVVSISPDLNASHMHADVHVPISSGNDVPFAMAMVQVILEEGIEDKTFIREQTDLPLLVRTDTKRYLRQIDVEGEGLEDQLYHWDPDEGLRKADRGDLHLHGRQVALEGTYKVTLHDGTEVEVEPVIARLKRMVDEHYTPEKQQAITGVHPDMVRKVARKAATSLTNIMLGWNSCKYYHGDLIERSMCLLLGVTGNWGKFGTGIRSWTAGTMDGQGMIMMKGSPGIDGTEQIIGARDNAIEALQAFDPTLTEELAARAMGTMIRDASGGELAGVTGGGGAGLTQTVEAFWWHNHAGFAERWNTPGWGDDTLPRTFDEYYQEAKDEGWWKGVDGPEPEHPPKVLIECGGNMIRRTRGGGTILFEHLWPKLEKIVSIDFRMSGTALWADLVLPAAQHYEKLAYHIPTPHQMMLTFSDKAAEPAGEALAEWNIFQLILKKFSERAAERGMTEYKNRRGQIFQTGDMWERYTLDGYMADEEAMADELVRDAAYIGVVDDMTTLDTMRDEGHVRLTGWGMSSFALAQASPMEKDRTHVPFRNHVELGHPFPTYSRRAQFYIDHPWWLEAGEELPVHKPNPKAGGDHPLRMTSGHNRWSIHAMNQANPVILQTHRGEPLVEVNPADAAARGVADDDLVRIWNDIAEFRCRAKVMPSVMPGQLISYNGWDPHQYDQWMGANEIEAGMVKWIAFAGGYGHISYSMAEWQPIPTDRGVPCDFAKIDS